MNRAKYVSNFLICSANNVVEHHGKIIEILPRCPFEGWPKVSFFDQCIEKQLITLQSFNIPTCSSPFFWFFSLKFWFKGQLISKKHLILRNAYKTKCFDRNINGNRDFEFLECDYLLVQRSVNLTFTWHNHPTLFGRLAWMAMPC